MLIQSLTAALLLALPSQSGDHPNQTLLDDADDLREIYQSPQAQIMLDQVEHLPVCDPVTVHAAWRPNRGYTAEQYALLDESDREGLRQLDLEPADQYATFYGSPLVYARILDLLHTHAPGFTVHDAKIMDLGYGQLGQLRLWAQMGADVTGVEIDPILTAIFTNSKAVGDIDHNQKTPGSITLVEGSWPNDETTRKQAGDRYDLLVSRNLLKRGYVKPAQLNPNFPPPVGWEMTDAEMLKHVHDLLVPGGIVVIESLGPKPDLQIPWSDISNPWPEQAWIDAGFEVLAHDQDESDYARIMGATLGWDDQMNLETDLFGVYSVYRKSANADSKSAD